MSAPNSLDTSDRSVVIAASSWQVLGQVLALAPIISQLTDQIPYGQTITGIVLGTLGFAYHLYISSGQSSVVVSVRSIESVVGETLETALPQIVSTLQSSFTQSLWTIPASTVSQSTAVSTQSVNIIPTVWPTTASTTPTAPTVPTAPASVPASDGVVNPVSVSTLPTSPNPITTPNNVPTI